MSVRVIGCPAVSREAHLTPVVLCGGSSCRGKREREWEHLVDRLDQAALCVERSKCLGVCDGPVAIVTIAGRQEVVARLRKGKRQRRFVEAATGQKRSRLPSTISGKARKKALARAARVLVGIR